MSGVRGHERNVAVQVGGLFGADVRPTRIFVWLGRGRLERIISLGGAPRPLARERRQRAVNLGPIRLWSLGSPAVTLAQAALSALVRPDEPPTSPRPLPRRSSSRNTSHSTSVR